MFPRGGDATHPGLLSLRGFLENTRGGGGGGAPGKKQEGNLFCLHVSEREQEESYRGLEENS